MWKLGHSHAVAAGCQWPPPLAPRSSPHEARPACAYQGGGGFPARHDGKPTLLGLCPPPIAAVADSPHSSFPRHPFRHSRAGGNPSSLTPAATGGRPTTRQGWGWRHGSAVEWGSRAERGSFQWPTPLPASVMPASTPLPSFPRRRESIFLTPVATGGHPTMRQGWGAGGAAQPWNGANRPSLSSSRNDGNAPTYAAGIWSVGLGMSGSWIPVFTGMTDGRSGSDRRPPNDAPRMGRGPCAPQPWNGANRPSLSSSRNEGNAPTYAAGIWALVLG